MFKEVENFTNKMKYIKKKKTQMEMLGIKTTTNEDLHR